MYSSNSKIKSISKVILGTLLIFSPIIVSIIFRNTEPKNIDLLANAGGTELTDQSPRYYFNKDFKQDLRVTAAAYLVGDLNTGEVILSKNADNIYPIASVSKLMTALVSTEIPNDNEVASVSKNALATYGTNGNFRTGEKIKTSELLYPLLLESSNDAAEILAEHFGRDNFIKKMNQQADILNMTDTNYEDPSGLSSGNKSTPIDLFKLAGYLKKEKESLLAITAKRSYSNKAHNWSSTNQFLRETGYIGGKSGYTDPALETGISIFSLPLGEQSERPVAIVLLRSVDRYGDVATIVNYLKKNVYYGGANDTNTDWVKQRMDIPDIRTPDFVTLNFTGDMMLDRGVKSSVRKNFDNDYGALFENLGMLKKADISFTNLEGTASDVGVDGKSLYSFHMDPTVVPAIAGSGIDVVSMANNHVGDWGVESYIDTLARLKENQIHYTGGGMNSAEAEEPVIIEKYGVKIGYLGFSDVGPVWMKATEDNAGLLLASNPRFDEIIKNASQKVDHLVVSFHWGDEYKTVHNARQEELAHKAIDAGAKIIIGHHPHVTQDVEIYKDGYIAYSLGNFIFDQSFSQNTMQGMLLEIKLGRDGSMTAQKNTIKLSPYFQPQKVIEGKEEQIKF
mgnify:CR=1 FL=1